MEVIGWIPTIERDHPNAANAIKIGIISTNIITRGAYRAAELIININSAVKLDLQLVNQSSGPGSAGQCHGPAPLDHDAHAGNAVTGNPIPFAQVEVASVCHVDCSAGHSG